MLNQQLTGAAAPQHGAQGRFLPCHLQQGSARDKEGLHWDRDGGDQGTVYRAGTLLLLEPALSHQSSAPQPSWAKSVANSPRFVTLLRAEESSSGWAQSALCRLFISRRT